MSASPGTQPPSNDDGTPRLLRRRTYGRPTDRPLIPAGGGIPPLFRLIALVCVIIVGVVGWFLMREQAPSDLYTGPGSSAGAPAIAVRLADEAEILAHHGEQLTVFRFASNRRVLVLDFASLREQGLMFNRVAALVEKVGLPKDRALRDEELDAAIARAGDSMETFYYGHDYAMADLVRFFALADRDGIRLRPQEEWLRQLLWQEKGFEPGARGAVISIPQAAAGHGVDARMRAAILRHELSHAEYFTNRAYADYARRFWRDELDAEGRAMFRRFLASQGYDPDVDDLMANEMQAYLMHTTDVRLFSAASLGVATEVLHRWQAAFLLGMPNGWLRDACVAALPSAGAVILRPRRARQARAPSSGRKGTGVRRHRRIGLQRVA